MDDGQANRGGMGVTGSGGMGVTGSGSAGQDSRDHGEPSATLLAATEAHAHARAILTAAAPPGNPSHAYLFHGPAGTGKRAAARAFATALLVEGASDPGLAAERVVRGTHPDLTWVTPSGASELLVADVDEPVVAAATRTPFESMRRVFVIEAAGTMNDQAANRLLKTLEEPASFVHLILLADHLQDVLPTIASRCQQVRFDPLPGPVVEQRLRPLLDERADPLTAAACARLCAGDGALAERLAGDHGAKLRACAEAMARWGLFSQAEGDASTADERDGPTGTAGDATAKQPSRPWTELLDAARRAGETAADQMTDRLREQAELLPPKERRKHEREGADAVRRAERRARAQTLDLGLRLTEAWLRDVWTTAIGVPELAHAVDRRSQLAADAAGRSPASLQRGIGLVAETRLALGLNVSEELALEGLAYGLGALWS
jgi:DNA polymerase-3 subunit delta'